MSSTFDRIMQDACSESLQAEYASLEKLDSITEPTQALSFDDIQVLSHKISALPVEYLNIIFFRYCFDMSPSDTLGILGVDNAIGKLRYVRKLLSNFMGLEECLIDDASMQQASHLALEKYTAMNNIDISVNPNYSDAFRRKLKAIKAAQKPFSVVALVIKRVAVFILVCTIGFSTALVANAQLRERIFNWVIETFPKYSIFSTQSTEVNTDITLNTASIELGYIPDGYKTDDIFEGETMRVYRYLSSDGEKWLTILFSTPGAGRSYYDTENAEIDRITFNGADAFTWQKDNLTYLIWTQDNLECSVIGHISKDEIMKVAENIVIKN